MLCRTCVGLELSFREEEDSFMVGRLRPLSLLRRVVFQAGFSCDPYLLGEEPWGCLVLVSPFRRVG